MQELIGEVINYLKRRNRRVETNKRCAA